MEKVYKVARNHGHDLMTSAFLEQAHPYCLEYSIGKTTIPKMGRSFAFNTLGSALRSVNSFPVYGRDPKDYTILECEAEIDQEYTELGMCTQLRSQQGIACFWRSMRDRGGFQSEVDLGTVFCRWIRPIRIVDKED